jgi:citronellyl-CoA synthetase
MGIAEITSTMSKSTILLKLGKELKPRPATTADCFAARVESTTQKFPEHTAVIFEGQTRTWRELNEQANRYAASFRGLGLVRGDTVSLIMENRIEYLAIIIALNKLGVTGALINTNLTGRPLVHCISITDSKMCIFGEERMQPIADVRGQTELEGIAGYLYVADKGEDSCPDWARDLDEEAEGEDSGNPPDTAETTLAETALYVFTSGTTGLPKAAVLSNKRYLLAVTLAAKGGLLCDENDCIYLCLPLYHGTGLITGVGSSFTTGASMYIRRKFSASAFLNEVREHGATCFIYIGELCRYLLNTPEKDDDYKNPLGTMMGNGLRPDVWHQFKSRFGINRIAEFYGASEGNLGFANLFNKDCTIGTTVTPHALIKYDVDADEIVRNSDGLCIKVKKGEPGLLLGKITKATEFEGYTSKEATESKILRDVFKKGDAWFNTGDLLKKIDVGFAMGLPHYQFVDRVGDTFRWKSENVSTNEVGEIINTHTQVAMCNVYGVEVPAADGRAGMAAMSLAPDCHELDLDSFSAHVNRELPPYARPVFLRIQSEVDTTGTFKMVKGELRKQGYDLDQVDDPVYVLKPGATRYEPLDDAFLAKIKAGEAGY